MAINDRLFGIAQAETVSGIASDLQKRLTIPRLRFRRGRRTSCAYLGCFEKISKVYRLEMDTNLARAQQTIESLGVLLLPPDSFTQLQGTPDEERPPSPPRAQG